MRWPWHEDWVSAVAMTPDGRRALSGGYDGGYASGISRPDSSLVPWRVTRKA